MATANLYDKAMEKFESGDKDEAQKMLRERSEQLKRLSRSLDAPQLATEAEETQGVGGAMMELSPSSLGGKSLLKKTRASSYSTKRRR
jgi:hypothetical protein